MCACVCINVHVCMYQTQAAMGRERPLPHSLHLGQNRWYSDQTIKARGCAWKPRVLEKDSAQEGQGGAWEMPSG